MGYVLTSYLTCLTILLTFPLYTQETKMMHRAYLKAYRSIFYQLLTDIPRYPRTINSRRKKLIFSKARAVMNLPD